MRYTYKTVEWEQRNWTGDQREKNVYIFFNVKYRAEQDVDLLKIIVCAR